MPAVSACWRPGVRPRDHILGEIPDSIVHISLDRMSSLKSRRSLSGKCRREFGAPFGGFFGFAGSRGCGVPSFVEHDAITNRDELRSSVDVGAVFDRIFAGEKQLLRFFKATRLGETGAKAEFSIDALDMVGG